MPEVNQTPQTFASNITGPDPKWSREKNWLTIKGGIRAQANYIAFDLHMFPDEISNERLSIEGLGQLVLVNRYERNRSARKTCIEKWGPKCAACGFDFEAVYGVIGQGFIHVHHLTPIATIKMEYQLDAHNDLRPVCPNCHSMLHRRTPPYTIDELKAFLRL